MTGSVGGTIVERLQSQRTLLVDVLHQIEAAIKTFGKPLDGPYSMLDDLKQKAVGRDGPWEIDYTSTDGESGESGAEWCVTDGKMAYTFWNEEQACSVRDALNRVALGSAETT